MIKVSRDCTCDRCGKSITDVFFTLTCYAEEVDPNGAGQSSEIMMQNFKQNMARNGEDRHLCRECKDAVTDGVFVL